MSTLSRFPCPCCFERIKTFDTKSGLKKHLLLCHQSMLAVDDKGRDCVDTVVPLEGVALQRRLAQEKKNRGHKSESVPKIPAATSNLRHLYATVVDDGEVLLHDTPEESCLALQPIDRDPLLSQGALKHPVGVYNLVTTEPGYLSAELMSDNVSDLSSGQDFSSVRSDWEECLNFEASADQNNNETGLSKSCDQADVRKPATVGHDDADSVLVKKPLGAVNAVGSQVSSEGIVSNTSVETVNDSVRESISVQPGMREYSPISAAGEGASSFSPSTVQAPLLDIAIRFAEIIPLPNFIDMVQSVFCHKPHHTPQQVAERLIGWLKINPADMAMKAHIHNIVLCCALFEQNFCVSLTERLHSCNTSEEATHLVMAELLRLGKRPLVTNRDDNHDNDNAPSSME